MGISSGQLIPLLDKGLGNNSYLLDLGDGTALAVDPPRDLRAVRYVAGRRGLRVRFAADTHLHADFLSGARQLAATDGATILASAAGRRRFPHRGLADGDEVDLGGLTLRALATPGHTDEHLAFLLLDGADPVGVFTGGSLIVGAAARTDLLGSDRAEELGRAQYASLQRLVTLPETTAVWPTHGSGSYCTPLVAARTSTIGAEKATNALLRAPDMAAFIADLAGSFGTYPRYFHWLPEVNRNGPGVIADEPALAPLDVADVERLLAVGALALDVRPITVAATGYIRDSIAIPLRDAFATWLGWLIDPDTPLVVIRDPDQNPADIMWPALKIGYERIACELAGGMDAWTAAGHTMITTPVVKPADVAGPVLDVRQLSEYVAGHLPGAIHIELGHLPVRLPTLPPGPLTVMCGHGDRATTAASLLQRAGRWQLSVLAGGADDWASATGCPLQTGT